MRNLLETFREQMQALESFGAPVHQWDAILIYHIREKLDSESRKAWELTRAGNDLQTIQQMTDFLSERCRALESSSAILKVVLPAETKTVNSANKSSTAKRGYGHTQSRPERGQAFSESATETIICQICLGDHKVQNCQDLTSVDGTARVDLVKQKKLCFNCIRSSNKINQCRSKSVCPTCRGKHHSLTHRQRLSNERVHFAKSPSSEADNSNQSATVSIEIAQSNPGNQRKISSYSCHSLGYKRKTRIPRTNKVSCILIFWSTVELHNRTMRTNLGSSETEVFDTNFRPRCVGQHTQNKRSVSVFLAVIVSYQSKHLY